MKEQRVQDPTRANPTRVAGRPSDLPSAVRRGKASRARSRRRGSGSVLKSWGRRTRWTSIRNRGTDKVCKSGQSMPRDANQLAKLITDMATGNAPPNTKTDDGKNPAAVALGRLGGLKGGKARAASLTKKKRSEIARKAASARWKKT